MNNTTNNTVITEYIASKNTATNYQSENELEHEFIQALVENGYEYLKIKNKKDLLENLRIQLEKLNNFNFSDKEWGKFEAGYLLKKNDNLEQKTYNIQKNSTHTLELDDGSIKNICILEKENIYKNSLQVVNQYNAEEGFKNRYDVTILVNGLPLVHVELKSRGCAIREAFNQIERYKIESLFSDGSPFDYIQLFVISNGTNTKYYSNTTRKNHIDKHKNHIDKTNKNCLKSRASDSFEFTSWWADGKNNRISDLMDFAKTFFSKHSLLSILIRYCVFTSDKSLLVMRPYQIAATEMIINKIETSINQKKLGTKDACGYIWHTIAAEKL